MATDQIIEKLRKLIAHEQSARTIGNIAEAEAFASKIQDLLTAHKLDMSEVDFQARDIEIDFFAEWQQYQREADLRVAAQLRKIIRAVN